MNNNTEQRNRLESRLVVLRDLMPEDDYNRVKGYADELLPLLDLDNQEGVIHFLDAALIIFIRGHKVILRELTRIEKRLHHIAERNCEGAVSDSKYDRYEMRALSRIKNLLGTSRYIFINGDPRGAAIKVKPEGIRFYEALGFTMHQDWGGYGYFV